MKVFGNRVMPSGIRGHQVENINGGRNCRASIDTRVIMAVKKQYGLWNSPIVITSTVRLSMRFR
jgi:hypothetical protein